MTFRRYVRMSAAIALAGGAFFPLLSGAAVREGEESVQVTITNNGARELPPEEHTHLRVFVHQERPSHRIRTPVCQATTNDARETYAFTGWHLPASGLTYTVNPSGAPRGIRNDIAAAIGRAAGIWLSVDGDKHLTDGGGSTVTRPRYDGTNTILWRQLSSGTIATAYIWYYPDTGEVLDADMIFNTRVKWSINDPSAGDCGGATKTYDVQAVATHEFGHWFGLDDLSGQEDLDLTMYGIVTHTELKKSTLGTGDQIGATTVAP